MSDRLGMIDLHRWVILVHWAVGSIVLGLLTLECLVAQNQGDE
jgi:hypothetical protein